MSARSQQVCLKCSQVVLPMIPKKAGGATSMHVDDGWRFEHHSADNIMLSSRAGCPVCRFLEAAMDLPVLLLKFPELRDRGVTLSCFSLTELRPPRPNRILISIEGTEATCYATVLWTTRRKDGCGTRSNARPSVHVPPSDDMSLPMDSPESFSLARGWLSTCLRDHQCRPGDGPDPILPTRVINVDWGDGSQLKLEDNATCGQYAALSYCWGESNIFITDSDNKRHHSNGFPLASLPRTLREAVKVARELGIRYLWIDALCIIQGKDDAARQDWEREVSRMKDVYSNAAITICATGSPDAEGGLFHPGHCVVPYTTKRVDGDLGDSSGFVTLESSRAQQPTDFGDEPLNSRAWTLQEHVLSPRVLMYTSSRMIWFCNKNVLSSRNKDNIRFAKDPGWGNNYLFSVKSHMSRFPNPQSQPVWSVLVENYCSRSLTDPSDKLPGIAGLAQRYHQLTKEVDEMYFAGIWKSKMAIQMLWCCKKPEKYRGTGYPAVASSVPSKYRAPSWSWAAIDGNVEFCRFDIPGNDAFVTKRFNTPSKAELVFSVISAYCKLSNPRDPFGAVTAGEVTIQGRLRKASRLMWFGYDATMLLGIDAVTKTEVEIADEVFRDAPLIDPPSTTDIHCLLCLRAKGTRAMGLILESVPNVLGIYRRIGLYAISSLKSSKNKLEWHEEATVQTVTII